jgi:hypothetical protein
MIPMRARRGTSSAIRRPHPRLVTTAAITSKQVGRGVAATSSGKRQVWLPMDHFEKLLEKTYPNHANLIKHNLKDNGTMKNFMASGSLAQGMEVDDTGSTQILTRHCDTQS